MLTHSRESRSRFPPTDPQARPTPRALILFLTSTLFVSVIILSGCTGVTSAKGNAVSSTSASTSSIIALSASPAALSFGNVSVGSTSNQSLTITNSGTSPVTISQANASGAGFAIGGVAPPVSLNPGNSATFTASFAPASTGSVSGAASFSGPQLSSTFVILMTGAGVAVAPSITAQPISESILVGQTATFSVNASGTAPLNYQWHKNGILIAGVTSASYTTPAETASDNGAQFSVVVSNSAGNVTSNAATLSVTASPVAPSVTTQPVNQTILAGTAATFSVIANGTSPLTYQWRKNGTAISGATSASYTTPAEPTPDSGALFSVVVSNSAGNVTSNSATLTVNPDPVPPSITSQPASQTITAGQTVTFSVTASGTAPLNYQSQKNRVAIRGATSTSYTTPLTTSSDNGALFTAVVQNSAGSVISNAAALTVNAAPAPGIQVSPTSLNFGNAVVGSTLSQVLIITNTGTATLSITQVTETGSAFFTVSGFSLPLNVNAGQQTSIAAAFLPTSVGSASGSISIVSNTPGSPLAISLSGTGMAPTFVLGANPTSLY